MLKGLDLNLYKQQRDMTQSLKNNLICSEIVWQVLQDHCHSYEFIRHSGALYYYTLS